MKKIVWFRAKDEKERAGYYVRTIERGKYAGLLEIENSVGEKCKVPSDQVKFMKENRPAFSESAGNSQRGDAWTAKKFSKHRKTWEQE